jgi:hypothetical protein
MVRLRERDAEVRFSATAVVLVTLVCALALSGAAIYQVFEEHRLLDARLDSPGPTTDAELTALRDAIGFRIIIRTTASTLFARTSGCHPRGSSSPSPCPEAAAWCWGSWDQNDKHSQWYS